MRMFDRVAVEAAIEAGSGLAILVLADMLEDEDGIGLPSLRKFAGWGRPPDPVTLPGGKYWGWQNGFGHAYSVGAEPCVLERLAASPGVLRHGDWFLFPSRAMAFLAIAGAE